MENQIVYVVRDLNYNYKAFSDKLKAEEFKIRVEKELGLAGYTDNRVYVDEMKIDDEI